MKKLAESWLRYARADLSVAGQITGSVDVLALAAFHCQQTLEKSLKALLVLGGVEPPRVHDLPRLWAQVERLYDLPENLDVLRLANEYYVDTRYPTTVDVSDDPDLTGADLAEMIEYTSMVVETADRIIRKSQ